MTDGTGLSEEELLEQEIWKTLEGVYYTLEEMPDTLLSASISYIEQVMTWRKDWLPALLCERERREELKEDLRAAAMDNMSSSFSSASVSIDVIAADLDAALRQTFTDIEARILAAQDPIVGGIVGLLRNRPRSLSYDALEDRYIYTVDVDELKDLLTVAASLGRDECPAPPKPLVVNATTRRPISEHEERAINQEMGIVGAGRLFKALHLQAVERAADKEQFIKEHTWPAWHDTNAFKKAQKDKYRK